MFTWIVRGSQEYYKDYKIEMTEEFKNRTYEILAGEDSIETYFKRCIEITKNYKDTLEN
jgi:hypothetical protein